ncbi:MAG: hypothetical protein ACXW5U_31030 [Thermoanaerobaculia bacterium]
MKDEGRKDEGRKDEGWVVACGMPLSASLILPRCMGRRPMRIPR